MAGFLTTYRPRPLSTLFRGGPLSPLREMEDVFQRLWAEEGDGWGSQLLAPPIDLSESDDSIRLSIDLPGVNAKEIDIQVSGNQLTVSGERKEEKEEKGATFHRVERRTGSFSRSVALPCAVKEESVDAQFRDGVLTVTLPKAAEAKTRHIKVKS